MQSGSSVGTRPAAPASRCGALTVCMFLSVAVIGFLEPFVPLFLELSGLKRGQIGLVSGAGAALALLVQPLLGRLSDWLDRRRPLMCAAAVAAGSAYSAFPAAQGVLGFALLIALGANGLMYLNTANAVLVGRMTRRQGNGAQCGGTYAAYRIWGSIGYVVVSLLAGWLLSRQLGGDITRASLAPLFHYGPLLFFLIAGVVWLLPDPRSDEIPSTPGEPNAGAETATDGQPRACQKNLNRFLRAYFLYIFAWTGSAAYLSLFLKSLGATPFWMTSVFATGVVCEVLVMSQVGRMSDRFGRRPLLAISFLAMPVRLLLYVPASGPLWVLAVQTLHGLNFGIMVAVSVAFISDVCTESSRGTAQAKLAATGGIASAFGPAVGGWVSQHWGLQCNFGLMAGVAAAGAAAFLWKVRESHPHPVWLYRVGPAALRPALHALCVPWSWLSRYVRLRRGRRQGA